MYNLYLKMLKNSKKKDDLISQVLKKIVIDLNIDLLGEGTLE